MLLVIKELSFRMPKICLPYEYMNFIYLRSINNILYLSSHFIYSTGSVVNEPEKIANDKDLVFVSGAAGRVGSRTVWLYAAALTLYFCLKPGITHSTTYQETFHHLETFQGSLLAGKLQRLDLTNTHLCHAMHTSKILEFHFHGKSIVIIPSGLASSAPFDDDP